MFASLFSALEGYSYDKVKKQDQYELVVQFSSKNKPDKFLIMNEDSIRVNWEE